MSGTLFEALRLVVVVAAVRASFKHSEVVRDSSRVDRCAHRTADNAVVTTASVHSTGATNAERARAEGENNP